MRSTCPPRDDTVGFELATPLASIVPETSYPSRIAQTTQAHQSQVDRDKLHASGQAQHLDEVGRRGAAAQTSVDLGAARPT